MVEGMVRRLESLEDGPQLQAGEVLVTTMTNVGWTPLFPRAVAIVTDLGAPLSHAAIVACELGIPAVVGCGNATMRLRTGDRVRVADSLVSLLMDNPSPRVALAVCQVPDELAACAPSRPAGAGACSARIPTRMSIGIPERGRSPERSFCVRRAGGSADASAVEL